MLLKTRWLYNSPQVWEYNSTPASPHIMLNNCFTKAIYFLQKECRSRRLNHHPKHSLRLYTRRTGPERHCTWCPSAYPKRQVTPYSAVAMRSPDSLWLINRWIAAIDESRQLTALRSSLYRRPAPHSLTRTTSRGMRERSSAGDLHLCRTHNINILRFK